MHHDVKEPKTRAVAADVEFTALAGIIYVLLDFSPVSAQIWVRYRGDDDDEYPEDLNDLYTQLADPSALPLQANAVPCDWPAPPYPAWGPLDLSLDCTIQVDEEWMGFNYGDQVGIAVMLTSGEFPTGDGDILPNDPFGAYFHYVEGEQFNHSNALVFVCDNNNETGNPLASYSFALDLKGRRKLIQISQLLGGTDPHIKNNG